ncbi:MAG: hypothetical protein LBI01_05385 [Elusimicrobium sp.]|nr:hypothetical protein [Elusimicrobium sp.]
MKNILINFVFAAFLFSAAGTTLSFAASPYEHCRCNQAAPGLPDNTSTCCNDALNNNYQNNSSNKDACCKKVKGAAYSWTGGSAAWSTSYCKTPCSSVSCPVGQTQNGQSYQETTGTCCAATSVWQSKRDYLQGGLGRVYILTSEDPDPNSNTAITAARSACNNFLPDPNQNCNIDYPICKTPPPTLYAACSPQGSYCAVNSYEYLVEPEYEQTVGYDKDTVCSSYTYNKNTNQYTCYGLTGYYSTWNYLYYEYKCNCYKGYNTFICS